MTGTIGAKNLTQMEAVALTQTLNLADGHPRQQPTPTQTEIIAAMPSIFHEMQGKDFFDVERASVAAYLRMLGQRSRAPDQGRILTCYSSSVALDIVARALRDATDGPIALIHPTFDNIPDILRAWRHDLAPVTETALEQVALPRSEAVFLTSPNNPTGWVLDEERYAELAAACARSGQIFVHDASFRAFDPRAQFNSYGILDQSGVDYVVIEDTGKIWPTLELKVGFILFSEGAGHRLRLQDVFSDILLSASPFVLRFIELLAADGAAGGLHSLQGLLAANRQRLFQALPTTADVDPASRVSVARVDVSPHTAEAAWRSLRSHGLYVLPCGPFHWADQGEGTSTIRVALARDPEIVQVAAELIDAYLRTSDG